MATLEEARAAKGKALECFSRLVGVASVGITRIEGGYGLKVNLVASPGRGVDLPRVVNDVPVRVEVVGPVRKR